MFSYYWEYRVLTYLCIHFDIDIIHKYIIYNIHIITIYYSGVFTTIFIELIISFPKLNHKRSLSLFTLCKTSVLYLWKNSAEKQFAVFFCRFQFNIVLWIECWFRKVPSMGHFLQNDEYTCKNWCNFTTLKSVLRKKNIKIKKQNLKNIFITTLRI